MVASDRKPTRVGKGGIDGEGTGACPVTAGRLRGSPHTCPRLPPSAGSDVLSAGTGCVPAAVAMASGSETGWVGVESAPPRTGWVQRRHC